MEENQVSRLALFAAYARAYHAVHDNPKIFDDFLAARLLTKEEHAFWDRYILSSLRTHNPEFAASFPDEAAALKWSMQAIAGPPLVLARSRYTEEILREAVRQGVRRYVILGAGLDTFAFRRTDLLKQLEVFELDHPATQEFKRSRLAELGWKLPTQLHFIPVDFTQENLAEVLKRSSYAPQASSFFSWLGVTYYLPRDTVLATLQAIAANACKGSMVVFDYLETDAFIPEKATMRIQGMLLTAKEMVEPMKAGFNPSTLPAELASIGLSLNEDLSPSDIEDRYFKGRADNYHALEYAHYACAVVE